jgi:redox-sensitive bicupin YhaK (pirin superfamily)
MSTAPVLRIESLAFPWQTQDPFLFCVHHDDAYPAGNDEMGPAASLAGRDLGQDFAGKDGWRMYHGDRIPGFPPHPHRGFETVTLARRGTIDHHDSLGAAARFGRGDVQWMTAGRGVVHSEMFPLVDRSGPNPTELFQIWLNLPRADKLVEPHFAMLWSDAIPVHREGGATVTIVAGQVGELVAPPPPPHSWAARPEHHVAIWTIALEPGARWTVPAAPPEVNRALYFFAGSSLELAGARVPPSSMVRVRPDAALELAAGDACELLLLQGVPIGEPVVQYGPFVMNAPAEIQRAFVDYQRTHFGGWPWPSEEPVHPRDEGRFARHADGRIERPRG